MTDISEPLTVQDDFKPVIQSALRVAMSYRDQPPNWEAFYKELDKLEQAIVMARADGANTPIEELESGFFARHGHIGLTRDRLLEIAITMDACRVDHTGVFPRPGTGIVQTGDGTGTFEGPRFDYARLDKLLGGLETHYGIALEQLSFDTSNLFPNQMRKEPYFVIRVSDRPWQFAVCAQIGEAMYVMLQSREDFPLEEWEKYNKDELQARGAIQVRWDERWADKLVEVLEQQLVAVQVTGSPNTIQARNFSVHTAGVQAIPEERWQNADRLWERMCKCRQTHGYWPSSATDREWKNLDENLRSGSKSLPKVGGLAHLRDLKIREETDRYRFNHEGFGPTWQSGQFGEWAGILWIDVLSLTKDQIWFEMCQSFQENGKWPTQYSGRKWNAYISTLRGGFRGLPSGSGLSQIRDEKITEAREFYKLTHNGQEPTHYKQPVEGGRQTLESDIFWNERDITLADQRMDYPPITWADILSPTKESIWIEMQVYYDTHNEWPTSHSGNKWGAYGTSMRAGYFGFPKGSSLPKLRREMAPDARPNPMGINAVRRRNGDLTNISEDDIWQRMQEYHLQNGRYPSEGTDKEWHAYDANLTNGTRGLPGGSSLADLRKRKLGEAAQNDDTPGSGSGLTHAARPTSRQRAKYHYASQNTANLLHLSIREPISPTGCTLIL